MKAVDFCKTLLKAIIQHSQCNIPAMSSEEVLLSDTFKYKRGTVAHEFLKNGKSLHWCVSWCNNPISHIFTTTNYLNLKQSTTMKLLCNEWMSVLSDSSSILLLSVYFVDFRMINAVAYAFTSFLIS